MTKDEQERAWEEGSFTRKETLELILPLVISSSTLIKSVNQLGKAMVDSPGLDNNASALKSLALASDAMEQLQEFQTKFKELTADISGVDGDSNAPET